MTQTASGQTDSAPATATKIMLIRHAEKPPNNPPPSGVNSTGDQDEESLIIQGWQRAGALVVFFAPSNGSFQSPLIATPQTIYASQTAEHSLSRRPQETVSPLINKLRGAKVKVNFDFPKGQETSVAESVLACEGVVLICWEHRNIPKITKRFPLSKSNSTPIPDEWPDDRYDLVWCFDLDGSAAYSFKQIPQLLLAGDTPI
jgi:hypothetical protein